MLIVAQQNVPLCLHTHIFDKTTGKDISNCGKGSSNESDPEVFAFKQWDTVTKWGLVCQLNKEGIPLMNKKTWEPLSEWRHFPNAETVFIIPNKNMVELVAIKILMLNGITTEDLKRKSRGFDLLSIMVAEAMDEPDVNDDDISFRSATDYDPNEAKKKRNINDYINIEIL